MLAWMNATLLFVAVAVVVGALRLWLYAFQRLARREPILPWQPRRPVPWGLVDLVLVFFVLIVMQSVTLTVSRAWFGVPQPAANAERPMIDPVHLMVFNVAYLLLFAVILPYFLLGRRASWRDLGVDRRMLGQDVVLGVQTFVMLAPIVYAIQGILVQWWPSSHPLVESIRENANPAMLLAGALAATVAAPLFEEFAFRLLLQGWLENVVHFLARWRFAAPFAAESPYGETLWNQICLGPSYSHGTAEAPVVAEVVDPSLHTVEASDQQAQGEADAYRSPLSPLPYRSPQSPAPSPGRGELELPRPWSYLPIVASTVFFALLHYEHGPDWVPLLVLAGGLGYVYQRTHRILPCIVVHFLINAVSYGVFLLEISKP